MVKQKRRTQRDTALLYYTIVKYVIDRNKLPSDEQLGVSKQLKSFHVKHLKTEGIIRRIGHGVWYADIDKWEQYKFKEKVKQTTLHTRNIKKNLPKSLKKEIRGHAYIIKLELPEIYKGYKLTSIAKKVYAGRHINNNGRVWSSDINNRRVWFAKDSILVFFNKVESFFGETAESCEKSAIYVFNSMCSSLENQLKVNLKRNKMFSFNIARSEYANVNNALASDYNKNNKKLRIIKDGKQWALIDNSFNLDEFEMVDARTSVKDTDNVVVPFFNDLKDHYEKTNETFTMSGVLEIVAKQSVVLEQQNTLIQNQQTQINEIKSFAVPKIKGRVDYIG